MIIDAVKKYFEKECDLFSGKKLNVNCLGDKVHSCTIDALTTNPIIQRYCDGSSMNQFIFVIATRETFDIDALENLNKSIFYEKLSIWIENQNKVGNLPILDKGYSPIEFQILSDGYVSSVSNNQARYQIQLKLIYEKE